MVGLKWTSLLVADRLREAGETLDLLPLKHPCRKFTSSWPALVSQASQYMDHGDTRVFPMPEPLIVWMKSSWNGWVYLIGKRFRLFGAEYAACRYAWWLIE